MDWRAKSHWSLWLSVGGCAKLTVPRPLNKKVSTRRGNGPSSLKPRNGPSSYQDRTALAPRSRAGNSLDMLGVALYSLAPVYYQGGLETFEVYCFQTPDSGGHHFVYPHRSRVFPRPSIRPRKCRLRFHTRRFHMAGERSAFLQCDLPGWFI